MIDEGIPTEMAEAFGRAFDEEMARSILALYRTTALWRSRP